VYHFSVDVFSVDVISVDLFSYIRYRKEKTGFTATASSRNNLSGVLKDH